MKINETPTPPTLYINRNLPEKIEGYFFFDGERLEDYFDDNSKDNIKKSVHNISQINLFKSLNKHLEPLKKSILGDKNKLKSILGDKNKLNTDFTDYLGKKTRLEDKISKNKKKIQGTKDLQDRIKKEFIKE